MLNSDITTRYVKKKFCGKIHTRKSNKLLMLKSMKVLSRLTSSNPLTIQSRNSPG